MTTSGTPETGNGIAEATSAFEKILAGESVNQELDDDAPEDPAEEAEALDASEDEDETPPDEDGAEDEEAAANDEDGEEEDEAQQERLITVKIDGQVAQLPESEVAKGYQRQADYSRHMQALRQDRQEVEGMAAQYAQLLPAVVEMLQSQQAQQPDWEKLYAEDPLEYVRLKEAYRERDQQLAAAQAEHQRMSYMQQQQEAAELQKRVAEGREELHTYNPAWKDKAKWDADRQRIRSYLATGGYSEEEISQAYDPRAVRIAHKAMLYDRLMSKKPQPVKQEGPKVMRASASTPVSTRKHTDISKAKMRLAKTGSVKDAAKLFEGLL